jgi:hypothetical protein
MFAEASREQREAYARWAAAQISGVTEFLDHIQHDRNSVQYQAAWRRFREELNRQTSLMQESLATWEDFKNRIDLESVE